MNDIQQQIKEKREQQATLAFEIERLISRLRREGCDHSEVEAYEWEHDSGYGVQTMIKGKRCLFCGFIDLWNRGCFVSPSEIRRYDDY